MASDFPENSELILSCIDNADKSISYAPFIIEAEFIPYGEVVIYHFGFRGILFQLTKLHIDGILPFIQRIDTVIDTAQQGRISAADPVHKRAYFAVDTDTFVFQFTRSGIGSMIRRRGESPEMREFLFYLIVNYLFDLIGAECTCAAAGFRVQFMGAKQIAVGAVIEAFSDEGIAADAAFQLAA